MIEFNELVINFSNKDFSSPNLFIEKYILSNIHYYVGIFILIFLWFTKNNSNSILQINILKLNFLNEFSNCIMKCLIIFFLISLLINYDILFYIFLGVSNIYAVINFFLSFILKQKNHYEFYQLKSNLDFLIYFFQFFLLSYFLFFTNIYFSLLLFFISLYFFCLFLFEPFLKNQIFKIKIKLLDSEDFLEGFLVKESDLEVTIYIYDSEKESYFIKFIQKKDISHIELENN